ncbi:hypothetical protein L9F63_007305 [Diploptera punctata]|uniref:hydroxyisourate hydrolase n=1 Tax=Diploptera punctata TaxID=6984 RepID=A0AAD8E423_DIPPU|nr:hypothetical protein L9F63_007305 [Diploptera punctata]
MVEKLLWYKRVKKVMTSSVPIKRELEDPDFIKTDGSKINPKYYKQAYRTQWESMPDFKDWLKGVPGEPNRAYCTFCKKTLHAHRLSLLKHTCTLKHTKAAQKIYELQSSDHPDDYKEDMEGSSEEMLRTPEVTEVELVEDAVVSDEKHNENEEEDGEFRQNDCEEQPVDEEAPSLPPKKMARTEMTNQQPPKGPLSTHVLDTAKGNPIGGLQVSLYKLVDGRWTPISEGMTNPDGRYANFIQRADFTAGRYKLHFDVDRYFALRKLESLYPFIEIVFDVKSPQDHYHVPLLLSPFGYTTYRGT